MNPPELNPNLNQNIELEKSNKININIDSKTPEIIGTDVKTPNLISGGINENIIQPFDINVQKQNLEIKVNNDNQENDDDYFKLTGVIKGTKDSNFKKENIINKTEENIRAPKIDINGNVVGGDIKPSHVLMAKTGDAEVAHSSIRFSFGLDNTMKDVERVMEVLPGVIKRLQSISTISM